MKKSYFALVIVIFVLSISNPQALADQFVKLSGTVRDRALGDPIANAKIEIIGTSYNTKTDSKGFFEIIIEAKKQYQYRVSKNDYEAFEQTLTEEVHPEALDIRLERVSATASHFLNLTAFDEALRSKDRTTRESALQVWGNDLHLLKRQGSYCMGIPDDSPATAEIEVPARPAQWMIALDYVLKGGGFTGYGNGQVVLIDDTGRHIDLHFYPFAGIIKMAGVDSSKVKRGGELFIRYENNQLSFGIGGQVSGEYPNFEFGKLVRVRFHTGRTNDKRVSMWIRRVDGNKL